MIYKLWHHRSQNELTGLIFTCKSTDIRCIPSGDVLLDTMSLRFISKTAGALGLLGTGVVVAILGSIWFEKLTRPPWTIDKKRRL